MYENVADLSLPLDLGQAEILERFEEYALEDGKIPRTNAVMALKYLHQRVKKEIEGKAEDARRRMQSELSAKLEEHLSNGAQATADENLLQAEIKKASTLLRETELRLKDLKTELRTAIETRENARTEVQLAKAKFKTSIQSVQEHIKLEARESWSHLTRFIKENTDDPRGIESESEITEEPPAPMNNRPFSEEEKRKVLLPDLPNPTFVMEEEMQEWTEMIKHRFLCWCETKRIATVLTSPVVVNLMESLKGRAHMGGVFAAWSRAVQGEQWDWGRWRDIKVSHLGWQKICNPVVTRLPPGSKVAKESHAELRRVDKILNKVCLRLFGIKAEPAWTQTGLAETQLNTAEQVSLHDVTITEWDEEAIKWVKQCKFSETELNDDEELDVSSVPVAEMPDQAPPGGPPPGTSSQEWSKKVPAPSTSPDVTHLDDDDDEPIMTVEEFEERQLARDRQSREERQRHTSLPARGSRSADSRSGHRGSSSHDEHGYRSQYSRDSSTSSRGSRGMRGSHGPRGGSRRGAKRGGRGGPQGSQFPRGRKGTRGGGFSGRAEYYSSPQPNQGRYR